MTLDFKSQTVKTVKLTDEQLVLLIGSISPRASQGDPEAVLLVGHLAVALHSAPVKIVADAAAVVKKPVVFSKPVKKAAKAVTARKPGRPKGSAATPKLIQVGAPAPAAGKAASDDPAI